MRGVPVAHCGEALRLQPGCANARNNRAFTYLKMAVSESAHPPARPPASGYSSGVQTKDSRGSATSAPNSSRPPWANVRVHLTMSLIKSKKRVADHGEVFTPPWMVEAMLDLVKGETERIDSRFLEPACGSGNFLARVLQRKLGAVELKFGKSEFEKRHYALLVLMCIYGIELLADNIAECRANLLEIFADYLNLNESDDVYRAASYVLSQNLVHGDALTMRAHDGRPITFAEWGYLGKGKFQRRDFRFDVLSGSSAFSAEGSLFAHLGKHEIFTPTMTYPPMAVSELATAAHGGTPKEAA